MAAPDDRPSTVAVPEQAPTWTASLSVDAALTKPEALARIAEAAGRPVAAAGTSSARVPLDDAVWASVDVPKFGEAPPLAVDVVSEIGIDHARAEAMRLAGVLGRRLGWRIHPMFAN